MKFKNFTNWMKIREDAVSEPEHESGEANLDVSQIIERRIQMLLDEIEKKKHVPKDKLIKAFLDVTQKLFSPPGQTPDNNQPQQPPDGQQSPPPDAAAGPGPGAAPTGPQQMQMPQPMVA